MRKCLIRIESNQPKNSSGSRSSWIAPFSWFTASVESALEIVRSSDGLCAVWLGAVDDLWKLGRPRGSGGPWSDDAVRAKAAEVGAVDVLFNCAGYVDHGNLLDTTMKGWEFSFDLNCRSLFVVTQAFMPADQLLQVVEE